MGAWARGLAGWRAGGRAHVRPRALPGRRLSSASTRGRRPRRALPPARPRPPAPGSRTRGAAAPLTGSGDLRLRQRSSDVQWDIQFPKVISNQNKQLKRKSPGWNRHIFVRAMPVSLIIASRFFSGFESMMSTRVSFFPISGVQQRHCKHLCPPQDFPRHLQIQTSCPLIPLNIIQYMRPTMLVFFFFSLQEISQ